MRIVIVGAGDNGVQVLHILKHSTHEVVGFVDDDALKTGSVVCGRPVLGTGAILADLRAGGIEGGIVAIGDNRTRSSYTGRLIAAGFEIVNAIHPAAMIDESAILGRGIIIEMGAVIHPLARIGNCVFLGGSSVISHHSVVEDNVLIGGGVIFGGRVHVGRDSLIGVGAVLQPYTRVGSNVVVGIGAAVVRDLPDNVVAVGVPARIVRENLPIVPQTGETADGEAASGVSPASGERIGGTRAQD
jgi:sugar O-acyltransferase (sialic acid O-acetyltransferase NeuD family)